MKDKTFETKFRRRREGKTNYKTRLGLVKSKRTRIVVRKTGTSIIAQAINYKPEGDVTTANAISKELDKLGFYGTNNTPSAYLTGYLLGKRMSEKSAILDIGMQHPSHGSVIFACLQGVIDAGVEIAHNKSAIPSEDRMNATVLETYAKEHPEKFSVYEKKGIKVDAIVKAFEKTKAEIDKVKQ